MNNTRKAMLSSSKGFCLRVFFLILLCLLVLPSCKNRKHLTLNNGKCVLDYKTAKTLTAHLKKNEFDFNTLNGKINAETLIDSASNSFSITLRIRKDSVIWMSISKLGIEGARVLITKDSVKFITKIPGQSNKFFKGDYAYISKLLNTELDFELLQALLVGNSVPFHDEDEKIKPGVDNCQYTLGTIRKFKLRKVMEKGKELKEPAQSIYLLPETYKIARILFYEFNPDRSFDARFGNYTQTDGSQWFPFKMNYTIRSRKNVTIDLEYSKVELNREQSFPFKIPDGYEQIIYEK